MRQQTLFDGARLGMNEAMEMTLSSIQAYGDRFSHWAVAWSGGKDSTATLTNLIHLLDSGQLKRPERLTVFFADTRMELPPLYFAAREIMQCLKSRGVTVQEVMAPMDKRFFVYMLGRGVPPPNNATFRWCTRQIKVEPMHRALADEVAALREKVLMITGVREGESAVRDARIRMSCGRNGAECGQGWYQETLPDSLCATLAPLLHWRVCHVWDWLKFFAPAEEYGAWPTRLLADVYGGDEVVEINARTGCVGCPLATQDTALDAVLKLPHWGHLAPLKELRPLYRWLREPQNRLRKQAGEKRKDGSLSENQHRMGPLTFRAREEALFRVLDIQKRAHVDLINPQEEARIRELIALRTWPNKWTGNEPRGDEPFEELGKPGLLEFMAQ